MGNLVNVFTPVTEDAIKKFNGRSGQRTSPRFARPICSARPVSLIRCAWVAAEASPSKVRPPASSPATTSWSFADRRLSAAARALLETIGRRA
jgi:hypothetical protein